MYDKFCRGCQTRKPVEEFHVETRSPDKRASLCKPCNIARLYRNVEIRKARTPVLPASGMKICNRCKESKLLKEFSLDRTYLDHHYPACKPCYSKAQRPRILQSSYGLTEKQYDAMHKAQNGRCAICNNQETHTRHGHVVLLSVDHNHTTGATRKLLCSRCNRALGLLGDSIEVLEAAVAYLKTHRAD